MSDAATRARELLAKAREEIEQLKARIAELEAGKPIIEGASVPGADIPDEVVEAAWSAAGGVGNFDTLTKFASRDDMRAALAAADAKRAELEEQGMSTVLHRITLVDDDWSDTDMYLILIGPGRHRPGGF